MSNQPDSLELARAAANNAAKNLGAVHVGNYDVDRLLADLAQAWANLAIAHAAIAALEAQEDA